MSKQKEKIIEITKANFESLDYVFFMAWIFWIFLFLVWEIQVDVEQFLGVSVIILMILGLFWICNLGRVFKKTKVKVMEEE